MEGFHRHAQHQVLQLGTAKSNCLPSVEETGMLQVRLKNAPESGKRLKHKIPSRGQ